MVFQFNLPANNGDLMNSVSDNYYVKNLYNIGEISDKLKVCKQALFQSDPFYIFDHFDTFYSVLQSNSINFKSIQYLTKSFDLLYVTIDKLGNKLSSFLSTDDRESRRRSNTTNDGGDHDRQDYLNLVKMTLFLQMNIVRKVESILQAHKKETFTTKKRGRASTAINNESYDVVEAWKEKRRKFLIQLYNIMQFPLERLWSPPLVEEDFVSLLCDTCYRILEILPARTDNGVVETIFQILGTAIKRYQHGITLPVKIIQILRNVEGAGALVAIGINILQDEYGTSSVLPLLIKEIVQALSIESADTAVSRNFSNFLMELATISPKLMIPQLNSSLCDELLNCDSYVVRNCILQIMGEAILSELTSEELTDEMKSTRNEFLDILIMHINDISAHVRSKVLQIWNSLKIAQAVPLAYQLQVLSGTIERLEDKTAIVRKHAVQLIKSFLERNIYSSNLTIEELEKKHTEETEKMDKLSEQVRQERDKAKEMEEKWATLIPEILPWIENNLRYGPEIQETTESYENIVQNIWALLVDKKYEEAVLLVRKADHAIGNSTISSTLKYEEQCAYFLTLLKSYMFLANGCEDSNKALCTQVKTVQFLQDSIQFSKMVSKAMPKLEEMLLSKINSDVFEAVDLFTTCYLFGIKGTEDGIHSMLNLVWSPDKEKRDSVSAAYKTVLFTTDQQGRAHALRVVKNLSRFLETLDYGQYLALECFIVEWVRNGTIDSDIIQLLFEQFTKKLEGTTDNEARLALELLIMCSAAKPSVASANISVIESIGCGVRGRKDPRIFSACIQFIMNSIDCNTKLSMYYKRYESDANIVHKIDEIYRKLFFCPELPDADAITMNTIQFYYEMCQSPDIICQNLILHILSRFKSMAVRDQQQQQSSETIVFSQPAITSTQMSTTKDDGGQRKLPVYLMIRFIFLIGYIALKELIFLDISVYNNMNYRQELTDNQKKKDKSKRISRTVPFTGLNLENPRRSSNRHSVNLSATESLKRLSLAAGEPQQEPDESLVGATAEDNIAELINHICEDVLLLNTDQGFLPCMLPVIVEICKFPWKYDHEELQVTACLTLIRLMCVSSQICEQYMPFLMSLLDKSQNIKLRCNIVTSLSDLTFRFPNVMEPWSNNFYAYLHDTNIQLRLTAVKMLSHLIQHEMIRVKGQIAMLALCIVDEVEEIKELTKQFFKTIASKSNILYNVLPDIISKLGDSNLKLEEEKYRTIMRYILGLIEKDRQVETLVDKLCLRFTLSNDERQWRDVAFCLSLLTYNERSLRKLISNVQYYKDMVIIDDVYHLFKTILSNTMRNVQKTDMKALVTELETRINECRQVNEGGNTEEGQDETQAANTNDMSVLRAGRGGRRMTTTKTKRKGEQQTNRKNQRRRRRKSSSSDDDEQQSSSEESDDDDNNNDDDDADDDESETEKEAPSTVRRKGGRQPPKTPVNTSIATRNRRTTSSEMETDSQTKKINDDDDDDANDDDLFEKPVAPKRRGRKSSIAAANQSITTRRSSQRLSSRSIIEETPQKRRGRK